MHAIRSKINSIENLVVSRVQLLLRLAGLVGVASGLIGGYVWLVDLADRSDGDSLRWGFWHNPFMQFYPFHEAFLEGSMWVLLACSAAAGLGGLMLLVPWRQGVWLVTWQARVSIIINGVIAFFIVAMMFVFAEHQWEVSHIGLTFMALALRLGSVGVDLMLWGFLGGDAVREFFVRLSHRAGRGFEVITTESPGSS